MQNENLLFLLKNLNSASSEKLIIIMDILQNLPNEKIDKINKLNISWTEMNNTILPVLSCEFFS